jgi:hypothetical protein
MLNGVSPGDRGRLMQTKAGAKLADDDMATTCL